MEKHKHNPKPKQISQEVVRAKFLYRDGKLFWKTGKRAGRVAGYKQEYIRIIVDKAYHYAQRLVWIYHNGDIPEGYTVTHINGDKFDNRIENLQLEKRKIEQPKYKKIEKNIYPSQEEIKQRFEYKEDGWLYWLNGRNKGKRAGYVTGYVRIKYKDKKLLAHRLIWIYHNGDIPEDYQIDHINGKKDDNRIENLRCVPPSFNHKARSDMNKGKVKEHITDHFGEGRL